MTQAHLGHRELLPAANQQEEDGDTPKHAVYTEPVTESAVWRHCIFGCPPLEPHVCQTVSIYSLISIGTCLRGNVLQKTNMVIEMMKIQVAAHPTDRT